MNQLIVQKYGGTSLSTLQRIENVAANIFHTVKQKQAKVVVVVSAMGSYTDELYDMAYALNSHPPKRELDMLVTSGERISTALLSIALAKLHVASLSLTGSQSGILTDDTHGNARIHQILGSRIKEGIDSNKVVIVAGFQGMSPSTKDITTLGRGGSDLTAIALASALNAEICQIFTDVDGIMTADPREVSQAKKIELLPWDVANELAWAGAGVLHHRGAYLARKYKMPLEILSSLKPHQSGTRVQGERKIMESATVYAIAHKEHQTLLRFNAGKLSQDFKLVSQLLSWLWKHEESPHMIRQYQEGDDTLCELLLSEKLSVPFWSHVQTLLKTHSDKADLLIQHQHLATLSVVGAGFRQSPEIAEKALQVLKKNPIWFEPNDNALTLCVEMSDMAFSLKALHDTFISKS